MDSDKGMSLDMAEKEYTKDCPHLARQAMGFSHNQGFNVKMLKDGIKRLIIQIPLCGLCALGGGFTPLPKEGYATTPLRWKLSWFFYTEIIYF